jgi:Dolichyl-phosphate-mannose-protein mannosyltransferase
MLSRAGATSPMRRRAVAAGALVDRWAVVALALLVLALGAMAIVLAARKPLWNDELFTLYISRLPSVGDIWSELETGVEQTPPAFYVVTRASLALFGGGTVAVRIPELLGYLLMTICVFAFVARRASPLYGLVAALFPAATSAYAYAYEARAYGLVLGFTASALLCWQVAADGARRRRLAAVGTAASLAGAVAVHYYAILVVIPLAAGELVRWRQRDRVDWLTVCAIGFAFVPLIGFAPLIRDASNYSTTFWAKPTWGSIVRFYPDALLDRALPAVLAAIVGLAAYGALRRRQESRRGVATLRGLPAHELVALLVLLLVPAFAVALGKVATGAYTERSALEALVALAILLAFAARWLDRGVPASGLTLVAALAVFAGARMVDRHETATSDAAEQTAALQVLRRHEAAGLATVVASPHDFFELSHRLAGAGHPRLVYLVDSRRALRRLGTDAVELGVVGMSAIAPLHTADYGAFTRSHARFLVYGRDRAWDWLSSALEARGARGRAIDHSSEDGTALYEVTLPGAAR